VDTFASTAPWELTFDSTGHLFACTAYCGSIYEYSLDLSTKSLVASGLPNAGMNSGGGYGIAVDNSGNLYAANYVSGDIEEINLNTQAVSLFATGPAYTTGLYFDGDTSTLYATSYTGPPTIDAFASNGAKTELTTSAPGGGWSLATTSADLSGGTPEPGTIVLVGSGLIAVGVWRRRSI
jgi:sugar lactone lactonase YvrE